MIRHFEVLQNEDATLLNPNTSPDRSEALSIILDRLIHDAEGNTGVGQDLFSCPKASIRKEMKDLLLHRIPEAQRKRTCGDAGLKKWLLATNSFRQHMFFTKDALIGIVAVSVGLRLNASLSFDALISKVVEVTEQRGINTEGRQEGAPNQNEQRGIAQSAGRQNVDPLATITQEVVKALLEKSFMKHLKGASRDHCAMGHKLELPIALDWVNDIHEKKLFHGFSFKIVSLHKVGLVAKKDSPWAKDSIDFIAFIYNEEFSCIELWGIEIKSRQTVGTISKEKDLLRKLRRRKYERIGADDVFKYMHKSDERWQLLHHAYVYGFDRIALIVGNHGGKVISGTVIDYDENLRDDYGRVLKKLKDIALLWAYDSPDITTIPDNVIDISEQIPTINGKETLYGSLKLWKAMFSNPTILPRPALQRIIPSTHAKWNATKGGSDTVTKLVDDCFVKPPRPHTNFETVAVGRCISNLLATVFRLYQLITSKENLQDSYPTIKHFRNAASQRMSFKKSLRLGYQLFKKEGEHLINAGLENDDQHHHHHHQQQQQSRPRRVQYSGSSTVPEPMEFVPVRTFNTPLRARRKQIQRGTVHEDVLHRSQNCSGFPYEVICQQEGSNRKDPRRRCYLCSAKTKWKCIKCKFYFCMTAGMKSKKRDEHLYYHKEKENPESNTEITQVLGKSCFHIFHEHAIQAALTNDSDNQATNQS